MNQHSPLSAGGARPWNTELENYKKRVQELERQVEELEIKNLGLRYDAILKEQGIRDGNERGRMDKDGWCGGKGKAKL